MLASLFLSANLGIIAGISLASFALPPNYLWLLSLIFIFYHRKFKVAAFFIIFLLLAFAYYNVYEKGVAKVDLSKYNGQKVVAWGRVSEEIDPGGNYQKVTVKIFKVNDNLTNGLALVSLPKYPELNYGDNVELRGILSSVNNFSDFKYDRYLARYDIYSLMSWPQLKVIANSEDYYSKLLNLKKKVYLTINSALPEPEAGLANALLLGYKGTLDTPEKEAFSCCGLSHIVAISGSHLTLLSALAFNFLLFFSWSRRQAFRPVLIFLWFYTFITGLQSSALRSAIMGHLTLWGQKNGRRDAGGRLLFCTAALMLLINPLLLRDDLGFQLSFLAMIALVYFCPLGEKIFGPGNLKSIIILTIAAQLVTWPISALNFGRFSLIAPLANLLVVWLFACLLPTLLLGAGLAIFLPALKVLCLAPAYFMLHYVIFMGNWLATWPRACIELKIDLKILVFYYIILILVYLWLSKKYNH